MSSTAPTAPPAAATTGAARTARERKARGIARHVAWLATNFQQVRSHHTGKNPVADEVAVLRREVSALQAELGQLRQVLREVLGAAHRPEVAQAAGQGGNIEPTDPGRDQVELVQSAASGDNQVHTAAEDLGTDDKLITDDTETAQSAFVPQQPSGCHSSNIGKETEVNNPHTTADPEMAQCASAASECPSSLATGKGTGGKTLEDPHALLTNKKAPCSDCGALVHPSRLRGIGICRRCWDEVLGDAAPWPE